MNILEQAMMALDWVENQPLIAYDTETSGVDWKRNLPVGYVFTVDPVDGMLNSVYIPVRHGGGGNLACSNSVPLTEPTGPFVQHWFETKLHEAFAKRDAKGYITVGHNMKFDFHMSLSGGVRLNDRLECTQNNEAMLDEHAKSFSLDKCVARRKNIPQKLGTDLYEHMAAKFGGKAERDQMEHFWRLAGNDELAVEYAAADGVATLALWHIQQAEREVIKEDTGHDLTDIMQLENDLIVIVGDIERFGIKVDLDRAHALVKEFSDEVAEILTKLPKDFNPRSPVHVKNVCLAAGRTDWPTTDKGNPSFTEKWLKTFPEGANIVGLRTKSNVVNSFLKPLIEEHTFNGRVHSSLNQLKMDEYGTISGRFSCSMPNLQQIPKHNKDIGPRFRSCFVADEGYRIAEADQSQAEPRMFAHYSGDERLVQGYNAQPFVDMHTSTAEALNVDRGTTGKRMNMGLLTGMQPKTFSEHMGWPLTQAREMFQKWQEAYPGIAGFQQDAKAAMKRRGYVKTILGRMCRLDDAQFAYKATSRIIQGGNADIIKYKLREAVRWIKAKGYDLKIIMLVHDSFLILFKNEDHLKELVMMLADVQSAPFKLKVPFCMDIGWGKNWSEATYGDDGIDALHANGWHK